MSAVSAGLPSPPLHATTRESIPTWAIHAAKIVAPKHRYTGEALPRLTERQVRPAVDARLAIERFVVLAAVAKPTVGS